MVSTLHDSPQYGELQRKLLALSRDSEHFVAEHSSHMVIIDEPEIVIRAIQTVVQKVKARARLSQ